MKATMNCEEANEDRKAAKSSTIPGERGNE
jgi:hypothetical protein